MRVDVVARTRKIGHFFPAAVDAFDVWIELIATDAAGKPFLERPGQDMARAR
ncbi:MAG: hypothetical protein WKF37_01790 [Bryobacteraceae bacterium]